MSKAMHRLDPAATIFPMSIEMCPSVRLEQRRPYVYSDEEIQRLLGAALAFPSPKAPLRPLSLYTMVVLAYCAGLRLGEIVDLTLADVNLQDGTIEIRETKFFKDRRLPLAAGVIAALKKYLVAREQPEGRRARIAACSGIKSSDGATRMVEWESSWSRYCAAPVLSRPLAGSGRESMIFVTRWWATVCATGTKRASTRNRSCLTWRPTSGIETSHPPSSI